MVDFRMKSRTYRQLIQASLIITIHRHKNMGCGIKFRIQLYD